jgi:nuclear pore complex protein Nup205
MGFGPIHAAILGLTTKTLNVRGRSQTMEPQTDSEMLDASAYGSSAFSRPRFPSSHGRDLFFSGLEAETKFAANANMKERLLRKAIITYLGNGSNFTGQSF